MTKKKQVGVRFDSNRTRLKTGETQRPNGTGKAERAGRTNHRGQARRTTVGCQKHHRK